MTGPIINQSAVGALSKREEEVLRLAASGLLDKEIGVQLGVSLNTLRTYWTRIRGKMGAGSRSALAIAYVGHREQEDHDEADWIIELEDQSFHWLSNREHPFQKVLSEATKVEDIFAMVHPEDEPRLRETLDRIYQDDTSAFFLQVRTIDEFGPDDISAFIRVVRNENGQAIRLVGRRVAVLAFRRPDIHSIAIGHWERDLRTGDFIVDEGFRRIFWIPPDAEDVRSVAMSRFHPDERSHTHRFVSDAVASKLSHSRSTHRLQEHDGSFKWVTTDLRIEYVDNEAIMARGTVIGFN